MGFSSVNTAYATARQPTICATNPFLFHSDTPCLIPQKFFAQTDSPTFNVRRPRREVESGTYATPVLCFAALDRSKQDTVARQICDKLEMAHRIIEKIVTPLGWFEVMAT